MLFIPTIKFKSDSNSSSNPACPFGNILSHIDGSPRLELITFGDYITNSFNLLTCYIQVLQLANTIFYGIVQHCILHRIGVLYFHRSQIYIIGIRLTTLLNLGRQFILKDIKSHLVILHSKLIRNDIANCFQ